MNHFNPAPYAENLIKLNEEEQKAIKTRVKDAREEAGRLAQRIKMADPSVRSVLLFGSVARGNPSTINFDIDLALDGGDVYKAMDSTEESPFSVDIVDLRLLPQSVCERIKKSAIIL